MPSIGIVGVRIGVNPAGLCADGTSKLKNVAEVSHTPKSPHSSEVVRITAKFSGPFPNTVSLHYQVVEPGKYIPLEDPAFNTQWTTVTMNDEGKGGDEKVGDGVFTVSLPAELQIHRRVVRYRVAAQNPQGIETVMPDAGDSQPNFAYFVYDGIPGWTGAIEPNSREAKRSEQVLYSPEVMRSIQAYHLIARNRDIENATWREQARENDYKYTGTFVADGEVLDHVRFRARGGVWRYAMGKNMWKIDFNSGHSFRAHDDFGRPYDTDWSKLNLRSCIQQGDYGHRGEQGMFEAIGFKLFNLAGVPAPVTHWVQLRIVSTASESPADQYHGDFWGLYLAIENEDGKFLKQHQLPEGNLYKMMGGQGILSHHAPNAVTNSSDLEPFLASQYGGKQPVEWWRKNFDLPCYYSYRSIVEAIHHYDIESGKNYDYYLNPKTGKWVTIPWDVDLTWADSMYGGGNEPLKRAVLSQPVLKLEYQNRLREIRDLLFNSEQASRLIDEYAAIIGDLKGGISFVDADRAKWDFNPIMKSRYVMREKAGQGLFYQASASGDFLGMIQLMKNYVKKRGSYIDRVLLNDAAIPETPTLAAADSKNPLMVQCSTYAGSNPFAAMRWRLGEVSEANGRKGAEPNHYEITPVWESPEIARFEPEIIIPSDVVKKGHKYRARVRVKDNTERWSHWSAPIQVSIN